MEYSVGSVAELISGINVANKTKVLKKKFKRNKVLVEQDGKTVVRKESNSTEKALKKGKSKRRLVETKSVDDDQSLSKKQKLDKEALIKKEEKTIISNDAAENHVESNSGIDKPKIKKIGKNEQNALNRIKNKHNKEVKSSSQYVDRTIFVGNIPIKTKKEHIKKYFRKFGQIESVRFRGIPVSDMKTTKKVAAIKKEFHPDRNTLYAFIRFVGSEDCKKAEAADGDLFKDHHLRVHCCDSTDKYDESKAIFIGNLGFDAEEEELWNLFSSCGPISNVRIVRDGRTGMGKGFAYVNFKDSDAVQLALEMGTVTLKNRELRISLCNVAKAKKTKKIKIKKPKVKIPENGINKKPLKAKVVTTENSSEETNGENKPSVVKKVTKSFSGSKFTDKKMKKKFNKGAMNKKKLAEKLTAAKAKVKSHT